VQDKKLGAVESSLQAWQSSFRSVRTEDVIVDRRQIDHIRLIMGHRFRGEPMPVLHTMVRRSLYHTFCSIAGGPIRAEECCACYIYVAWHDILSGNRTNISIYV